MKAPRRRDIIPAGERPQSVDALLDLLLGDVRQVRRAGGHGLSQPFSPELTLGHSVDGDLLAVPNAWPMRMMTATVAPKISHGRRLGALTSS